MKKQDNTQNLFILHPSSFILALGLCFMVAHADNTPTRPAHRKQSGSNPAPAAAAHRESATQLVRKADAPQRFGPKQTDVIYGPPLPRKRVVIQEQASQLIACYRSGRLVLTNQQRDEEQLRTLALHGIYCWPAPPKPTPLLSAGQRMVLAGTAREIARALPSRARAAQDRMETIDNPADDPDFNPLCKPPSPLLLRLLTTLASRSTPSRPLELMSLLRPPYRVGGFIHVGLTNPHSLGLAADIAAYGGYRICQDRPEDCVQATLALIRDLPSGRYRLGMPKAPDAPLIVGCAPFPAALAAWLPQAVDTDASTQTASARACLTAAGLGAMQGRHEPPWPFFPAPKPLLEQGRVAPLYIDGKQARDDNGQPIPCIVQFRNESYAELDDLHDMRLQRTIAAARKRGVEIVGLFPDGKDHIHVDVRQSK